MKQKLPPEAFAVYLSMGHTRSYETLARHFGVQKRTVTAKAKKENWQAKLEAAEAKAREKAEERAQETLEEMNERHMKMIRLVQKKSLEGLRDSPIASGMDAARALLLSIDKERLVRGEPTERTALDTEALIRREAATWMTFAAEDDWSDAVEPERDPPAKGTNDGGAHAADR